jgi:hypothetical protein
VALIVVIGIAIGSIVGTWLGLCVTALFGDFFHFPFLLFAGAPDLYVIAGALSAAAAIVGAIRALREVVRLPPATAMQPPAPQSFRRLLPARFSIDRLVSQPTMMMLRNISRHPVGAAFTMLGMALATAILVVSLFTRDTMEQLIDVTYFLADRQDATIGFIEKRAENVVRQVERLPGVLAAEPFREVPVRIRHGNIERRITISGRLRDTDLKRIIDVDLWPVVLPATGLAISSMLGQILCVQVGDAVEVDLLEGARRTVFLPVVALVEGYFGIRGMMDRDALARLMRESPVVNSVNLSLDESKQEQFYTAVKAMPTVSGVALQRVSLANFRESVALLVTTMASTHNHKFLLMHELGPQSRSPRTSVAMGPCFRRDDERMVSRMPLRSELFRPIRRQEHMRGPVHDGCDLLRRGCWLGLEDEGLKQRGLTHLHELPCGEFVIIDREVAEPRARLEISREAIDGAGQHLFVEAAADFRHAFGNRHHGADRRAAARAAEQLDVGASELGQCGLDVSLRIEIERDLALFEGFLLDDGFEQAALVGEVNVQRALGDAGGAGNLAHAGAVKAEIHENRAGAVQYLAPLGAVLVADEVKRVGTACNHWLSLPEFFQPEIRMGTDFCPILRWMGM